MYLTEDQARDIKLRARRENKHEAEVIRELLNEGMKKSASKSVLCTLKYSDRCYN